MEKKVRTTSTGRNRRFRSKVQELGYRRLEIIAGVQSIEHLRKIVGLRKMQTYEAFEQAVKLLVQWHNADVAGNVRPVERC